MVQGHDHIKMATSIIDYVFRELAITYLGRNDLAQVPDEDLRSDALGRKALARAPWSEIESPVTPLARLHQPATFTAPARHRTPLSGGSGFAEAAMLSPASRDGPPQGLRGRPLRRLWPVHQVKNGPASEVHHVRDDHGVLLKKFAA